MTIMRRGPRYNFFISSCFRLLIPCLLSLVALPLAAAEGRSDSETGPAEAVIRKYCIGCHNERVRTAGFAIDPAMARDPGAAPEVWERVVRKLHHRHMPPVGMPRPDEATYNTVVSSLVSGLDRAAEANPNPGRTDTFRRLNRTEYRNAIRDLLALDVDVSSLLPADETAQGFDNITVGELSPTLLERYLVAAQKISRLAVGTPVRSPGGDTILIPPDLTQEDRLDGMPFGTRGGASISYNFPLNAEYEVQLRLSRDRNERVEGLRDPHDLELAIDGKRIRVFSLKPVPTGSDHMVDQDLKVRLPLNAGPHEITATFIRKTSALAESERQPYVARFNMDRHPRMQPALYSISIVGPYEASGPGETPSRQRIFTCRPQGAKAEDQCAREILSTVTRRAYRRAVTADDLVKPLQFFEDGRREGGFEAGIEAALRAILVSPNFLFRIERDPAGVTGGEAYQVTDTDLASRLSFFLWSSIPDDELLDAAIHGTLRQPAVLEQQVRRMLADPRSRTLVNNFAAQWLYLRNLEAATPDPRLFPDFDENLRQAFRRETEMLIESIVREDRNVLDLLRARYTFVNERLARHYGIPNVYGSHFRRVELEPGSVRGGLLGHGSILTVTSYATRTSPVIRGKWILTNVLGTPPPPPPPDVPELKEKADSGKALSMRERVALHRDNPACASCHNLMDPAGFALENFDAIGRWRDTEDGLPVDPTGNLPDGTRFDGPAQLQQAILRRPDLFVTTVTEKLLTFALGRGLEAYDAPSVRAIVSAAGQRDYRFSEIILEIVKSRPFQMRRSQ